MFALLRSLEIEKCLMLRFALYGVGLLCLWERAVTCHGWLRFVRGKGKLSNVIFFVFISFVLFCSCDWGTRSHVTIWFALLCLALYCSALLCIALLVCGMTKIRNKNML